MVKGGRLCCILTAKQSSSSFEMVKSLVKLVILSCVIRSPLSMALLGFVLSEIVDLHCKIYPLICWFHFSRFSGWHTQQAQPFLLAYHVPFSFYTRLFSIVVAWNASFEGKILLIFPAIVFLFLTILKFIPLQHLVSWSLVFVASLQLLEYLFRESLVHWVTTFSSVLSCFDCFY